MRTWTIVRQFIILGVRSASLSAVDTAVGNDGRTWADELPCKGATDHGQEHNDEEPQRVRHVPHKGGSDKVTAASRTLGTVTQPPAVVAGSTTLSSSQQATPLPHLKPRQDDSSSPTSGSLEAISSLSSLLDSLSSSASSAISSISASAQSVQTSADIAVAAARSSASEAIQSAIMEVRSSQSEVESAMVCRCYVTKKKKKKKKKKKLTKQSLTKA